MVNTAPGRKQRGSSASEAGCRERGNGMSAAFGEKSPTVTFASLESHKIGGIVRLPREIDEQSIVAMGQFLARYGAVEFARVEDNRAFNADGGGTYESVKGVVQIARDNSKTVVLASTKTHPSD